MYTKVLNYIHKNSKLFGKFAFNACDDTVWHRELDVDTYSQLKISKKAKHILTINTQLKADISFNKYTEIITGLASLDLVKIQVPIKLRYKVDTIYEYFLKNLVGRELELSLIPNLNASTIFDLLGIDEQLRITSVQMKLAEVMKNLGFSKKLKKIGDRFSHIYKHDGLAVDLPTLTFR